MYGVCERQVELSCDEHGVRVPPRPRGRPKPQRTYAQQYRNRKYPLNLRILTALRAGNGTPDVAIALDCKASHEWVRQVRVAAKELGLLC